MPPAKPCLAVAAALVCAGFAVPAAALELFGPSCLEKLTRRTQVWAECTAQFDRSDSRCRAPTGKMHNAMQKCSREGASKSEIDAAMTDGYRAAGARRVTDTATSNGAVPPAGTDASAKNSKGVDYLDRIRSARQQAPLPPPDS